MKPRWKQQKVGISLTKMRIQPTPGRVVNARLEDAAALFFSRQPRSVVLNIETVLCRRVSSVVSVAVHVGSKCTWTSHSVAWYMLRKRTWRYHAPPHPTPPHPTHVQCAPPQTRSRKNAVFARKNAKKAEISCCFASVKLRVYRPTEPPTIVVKWFRWWWYVNEKYTVIG